MAIQVKKVIIDSFIEEEHTVIKGPNEELFYTFLQRFRPDLFVLADLIDKNKFNVFVIFQAMKHILEIAAFKGWGKVIVHIEEGKVKKIDGVSSTKMDDFVEEEKNINFKR